MDERTSQASNPVVQSFLWRLKMDDPKNRHQPDRSRVNTSQEHEVRYWCGKFGCSVEELREAVRSVGSSPEAVEKALEGRAHH